MNGVFTLRHILTSHISEGVAVLTLTLSFLLPQNAYAVTDDNPSLVPVPMYSGQVAETPLESLDKGQRLGLLLDYVRKEVPGWAPGIRDAIRGPLNWTKNNWMDAQDSLGLVDAEPDSKGLYHGLMQAPSAEMAEGFWVMPDYHHKGFLPFNDAMQMNFNLRHSFFDRRLQVEGGPFYAQNWMSLNGYEGAEIALNLRDPVTHESKGRFSIRYTEGDQDLMDHGQGIDLHAEYHFNEQLSLHGGIRENEETQLGNYVMLRWKLTDFGK